MVVCSCITPLRTPLLTANEEGVVVWLGGSVGGGGRRRRRRRRRVVKRVGVWMVGGDERRGEGGGGVCACGVGVGCLFVCVT